MPLLARQRAARAPEERLELGAAYLRHGFYRDGWALYEARREMAAHPEHVLPTDAPAWTGRQEIAGGWGGACHRPRAIAYPRP